MQVIAEKKLLPVQQQEWNDTEMNITSILQLQAKEHGELSALISQKATLSYRELDLLAWKCAQFFYSSGIRKGDVIASVFINQIFFSIALLGLARIGATLFPLSRSLTEYQRNELLFETNSKLLLSDRLDLIDKQFAHLHFSLNSINNQVKIDLRIMDEVPNFPLIIVSGSGSTGKPKLIALTHSEMMQRSTMVDLYLGAKYFSMIQLHFLGEIMRFFGAIYFGSTFYFISTDNLDDLIYELQSKKIEILGASVFHLENILKIIPENKNLNFLKQIRTGGSMISLDLRKRIYTKLGLPPYIIYGTNETGYISICKPEESMIEYSVGKVLPDVNVDIFSPEKNAFIKNEIGQILVKSDCAINSYLNDKKLSHHADESWFSPNDFGKIEDGVLYHFGRSDEVIITNGICIYPAQIESCLLSHPSVEDVAIVPFDSTINQQIAISFVKLRDGHNVDINELISFARNRLGFYAPKGIYIVNAIPRNNRGKVIREELIEIFKRKTLSS